MVEWRAETGENGFQDREGPYLVLSLAGRGKGRKGQEGTWRWRGILVAEEGGEGDVDVE